MPSFSRRLRLFGLIQDLHKEAAELGLSRTAAALEATTAVAMEEISDDTPRDPSGVRASADAEEDEPA